MAAGSTVPVGLLGLHTNTIVGRVLLDERAGDVGIDGEVGAPLPHHHFGAGDAGDVASAARTWARTRARADPAPP